MYMDRFQLLLLRELCGQKLEHDSITCNLKQSGSDVIEAKEPEWEEKIEK